MLPTVLTGSLLFAAIVTWADVIRAIVTRGLSR
jgi:hypothetical protein